jgi:proteasome accessory factor B
MGKLTAVAVKAAVASPGTYQDGGRDTLAAIMQAILSARCLEFNYMANQRQKSEWRRVTVCGLLHGPVSYLVGQQPGRNSQPLLYRLDRMENTKVSDVAGKVPDGFELDNWVAHSFGIWRDAQEDIVLRALPHCTDRARQWRFHPDQQINEQQDGSIVIRFRASGLKELADHIFTRAGGIEIISPAELRSVLQERLDSVQAMLNTASG